MISLANLFKLSRHKRVDDQTLDELFSLERSTLITTMLLETILLYILTPLIGNIIIAWYGVIMVLSLWRFYNAHDYTKHPERNTPLVWHEKFVVQVWATALLFSLLALFAIPKLDAYYQLFTFIVLIGISSGAIKALSSDHRTAIGYLLIILLPLMVEMILLMRQDTLILAFLVAIYLFVQIGVLLHSYELSVATREAQKEIEKTRAALEEKQAIIQRFFEQTDEALFLYDRDRRLIDCNPAFEILFHVSPKDVSHYTIDNFPDRQWVSMIRQAFESPQGYFGEYTIEHGQTLWLEAKCIAMGDQAGETGGIGLIKNKTVEHLRGQELAYMALHDPMTGLSNRRGFQEYMTSIFYDTKHSEYYSLFFYIDVNKFKQINDRYGHETGDHIIIEVSNRLKKAAPKHANLTRLGGDEFCMVVPHVTNTLETLNEKMESCMSAIQQCYEKPFQVGEHVFDLRCSTGVVIIQPGEMDIDKIVAQADISMLQAKRSDSTGMVLYSNDLEQGECQAYEIHHTLGDAIDKEQLEVFYQPITCHETDRAVAAEALVRWRHPEKGLLSPYEFLSVAVRSGQVMQVDSWMLDEVLRQISAWKKQGTFGLRYVSINIDLQLLISPNFVQDLLTRLKRHGVRSDEIRLELSETSLVEHLETVRSIIQDLNVYGIMCMVDDFGTGCLSLFQLKDLPLEVIKVDRIFTEKMTEKIENIFLIQTVLEIAEKFRYEIIVKGIESEEQYNVISNLDPSVCYQGSLSSPPLSVENFTDRFLREAPQQA